MQPGHVSRLTGSAPGHIASLLVRYSLANKGKVPFGWAPRILVQCGVPYPEIWDILYEMYESQVRTSFSPRLEKMF